jgi:hypothetical protein
MSTQGETLEHGGAHNTAADPTTLLKSAGTVASDAAARLSDAAQAAGREAKCAASGLAAEANQNVKGLLNNQLDAGADLAGHLARATRAAADNLVPDAPQLAGFVRTAAGTIDDFSGTMRDSSVDELFLAASQFTRRQPAAVFGAAALAGFFLFRLLKVSGDHGQSGGTRHGS